MQSRSRIQTTGPNNGHQLRDYSKSSNRSENRPLIYTPLPNPLGKRVIISEPLNFPNWALHRVGNIPAKR